MARTRIEHRTFSSRTQAERFASRLGRSENADVSIVARRNSHGRFSRNGQQWSFRVELPELPEQLPPEEWLIAVRYKGRRNHQVSMQVSMFLPHGATRTDAAAMFNKWQQNGSQPDMKAYGKDFRDPIVVTNWSHGHGRKVGLAAWNEFSAILSAGPNVETITKTK